MMSDHDKVMALTTCYKALQICHIQLQSFTASHSDTSTPKRVEVLHLLGTASILVENFEQHFKLVGRQCYQHVYTLFVQMHRTTSHMYHPNYPTLSTDSGDLTNSCDSRHIVSKNVCMEQKPLPQGHVNLIHEPPLCVVQVDSNVQVQNVVPDPIYVPTPTERNLLDKDGMQYGLNIMASAEQLAEKSELRKDLVQKSKGESGTSDSYLPKSQRISWSNDSDSDITVSADTSLCSSESHTSTPKRKITAAKSQVKQRKSKDKRTDVDGEQVSASTNSETEHTESSEYHPINAHEETYGNTGGHMVHQPISPSQRQIWEYFDIISESSVHVCLCFDSGKYRFLIKQCGTASFSMESEICSDIFPILKQKLFTQRTSTLKKVVVVVDTESDCITQSFIIFLQPHLFKNFYFQVIPYPPGVTKPETPQQIRFSLCTGRKACIVGNPTISPHFITDNAFPDLPAATKEAKLLSKLFESEPLIHEKATKEAVISKLRDARFVHIASHCVKGEGLVLCDNTITAEDVERLEFQNEPPALVVLNCCDSAESGMEGLALAFLKASVPTVIVIHGKIEDELAYEFTECFYSNMIKEGIVGTLSYYKAMMTVCNSSNSSVYVFYGKDIQFTS